MDGSRSAPLREVSPDAVGGGAGDFEVAGCFRTELFGDEARFQPGDSIDGQDGPGRPAVTRLQGQDDGWSRSASLVRRWTPPRSSSREAKPSRMAESWLPEVSTTVAPAAVSRTRASSSSPTTSTPGRARS
ncbi:hypothetical protein AHiyo4_30530 [Arthrobacter sp. Hiyo4]|nr:hypothetical protein AHiyo4_30530 [Arthrobacter sp. Hiyo4]